MFSDFKLMQLPWPEMVRIASPVYLKTGTSALRDHGTQPIPTETIGMIHHSAIVLETVDKYQPSARQS